MVGFFITFCVHWPQASDTVSRPLDSCVRYGPGIRGVMKSALIRVVSAVAALALLSTAWAQQQDRSQKIAAQTPAQQIVMSVPQHPERPVVVELFSSQGCGNCPEANRNLAEMSKRTDVIALTYPVGYWDYLGWDDTFAKPEFTERQKRYNRVLGHRGPYTPQVIYSGRLHGSGVDLKGIMQQFAKRDITPYATKVDLKAGEVVVTGVAKEPAGVILVRYAPGTQKVTPGKGANQGKAMTYFNLVTSIEHLGEFTGETATFKTPQCGRGCVVMVQTGGSEGTIIGAGLR